MDLEFEKPDGEEFEIVHLKLQHPMNILQRDLSYVPSQEGSSGLPLASESGGTSPCL
jgi:hypothetical protein